MGSKTDLVILSNLQSVLLYHQHCCAFLYKILQCLVFAQISLTPCSLESDATKIQPRIAGSDAIFLYLISRKPVNQLPGEKFYPAKVPAGLHLGCRGNCPPPFPSCSFLFFPPHLHGQRPCSPPIDKIRNTCSSHLLVRESQLDLLTHAASYTPTRACFALMAGKWKSTTLAECLWRRARTRTVHKKPPLPPGLPLLYGIPPPPLLALFITVKL